jgi:predicted ATPase
MMRTSRTETCLVAGSAGVGKSRLVGEASAMVFAASVSLPRPPVIVQGKFDQYTRYIL